MAHRDISSFRLFSRPASQAAAEPLVFHGHHKLLWRTLYIWVWGLTFLALLGGWLGLRVLPLQDRDFTTPRPQVSVRIDKLLAVLQGQPLLLSGETTIPTMAQHLLESTQLYGLLPKRAEGDAPWRHYSTPVVVRPGGAKLAIIVSGLGLSRVATERAVDLPNTVTLAFSPYGESLTRWALFAREKGHELLLALPVEAPPQASIDAGSLKLSTTYETAENMHQLKSVLGRMTGYVGLIGTNDALLFKNQKALSPLVRSLAERGLLFIDPRLSGADDPLSSLARRSALPLARVDVALNRPYPREEIERRLKTIVKRLRRGDKAIVLTVAPYPATLESLAAWLQSLPPYAQVLPISALFSRKTGREKKF